MKVLLRAVIPPILFEIRNIFKGLYVFLFHLHNKNTVKYDSKQGRELYILGNGPSINESLEKGMEKFMNTDCMVVNHFADSPLFRQIKPSFYLLADPAFAKKPEDLSEFVRDKITKTIKHIKQDVDWHLVIYLPVYFKKSYLLFQIKDNPNIEVSYYNNGGRHLDYFSSLYFALLNRNLIKPLSQTVLNTCISIAITMRYSKIFLVGADTSWHENYWMDQKTNELFFIDKHFYGTIKRRCIVDSTNRPVKIHEELLNDSNALQSYWYLADYAEYNGVKVYNASAYSWIDAFERIEL